MVKEAHVRLSCCVPLETFCFQPSTGCLYFYRFFGQGSFRVRAQIAAFSGILSDPLGDSEGHSLGQASRIGQALRTATMPLLRISIIEAIQ